MTLITVFVAAVIAKRCLEVLSDFQLETAIKELDTLVADYPDIYSLIGQGR